MATPNKTYVVEHLDPELEQWSALEYKTIARECVEAGAKFVLSSVPATLKLPNDVCDVDGLHIEQRGVEEMFVTSKERVCLLDPAAPQELDVTDGEQFDVFLFGGILGDDPPRAEAKAKQKDRTSELRQKGFAGRRLGPVQMTTDTAVRVTRKIVQEKVPYDQISFIDFPEIKINIHESTEMPFRYVKDIEGKPVMPPGMIDLIQKDSEKGFEDLL